MMKVVIIEDEMPAAERLKKILLGTVYEIEVLAILTSLEASIAWINTHPAPDLIFMDIELSDGLSLDLVKHTNISCPVIFITAYDEYWQEAFELNSIDYLLKPLKKERLDAALKKFNELKDYFTSRFQNLLAHRDSAKTYKDRFLVKRGIEYVSIKTENIAFFYASHKLVCLVEKSGSRFILDHSLADMEKQVDPHLFYRINRKYLLRIDAIKKIHALPKSKLLVETEPAPGEELIISSENSNAFKKWMDR